jgi:acyl-CoA synthetase (AMP-forming)/AMP-acid ligase II
VAESIKLAHINPRSVIGISLLDAADFLTALFGTLYADCIAIPVPPNLSPSEQERILLETGVSLVITDRTPPKQVVEKYDSQSQTEALPSRPLKLFRCKNVVSDSVSELFSDAAVIRYTSGTTGRSKGVVLSHTAVIERTEASINLMEVTSQDKVLAPLPLAYHFVASALSFIRVGAVILDCLHLSGPEMLSFGRENGATIIYGSPLQYELLARSAHIETIPTLRRAISTSTILPAHTAEIVSNRLGCRITQVYGIIEVGLPLWNSSTSTLPTALGTCRKPYECKVLTDSGEPALPGDTGELLLTGPGLFSGYLTGIGAGVRHERQAWFATGDIVTIDQDGIVLYRGRKKNVINCGGNKVFPEEVEGVLMKLPEVESVRVSAEPHPLLGDLVIAEVVLAAKGLPNIEQWRAICYRELSGYKVPKEFRIVSKLPKTGSGKVMYHNG